MKRNNSSLPRSGTPIVEEFRELPLPNNFEQELDLYVNFLPEHMVVLFPFLAMETSTFVAKSTLNSVTDSAMEMMRIEHKGEPLVMGRLDRASEMTMYEESLLQIPDYHAVKEKEEDTTQNPIDGPVCAEE